MKLAGPVPHTSAYFWPPGGGAHENWQVLTYIFDRRAGAQMKLAGPVPHTSAYFWPPCGGAHEIGKYLRIFLIAGRGRT